ncbi:type II toxin-antitoxin system HigB family toxin [Candidatus Peregrinibacteria bacterium]|nr:type II toxin-antitoxin system HigB family toxin [Candidatus Peregrinibacteria bacterium]
MPEFEFRAAVRNRALDGHWESAPDVRRDFPDAESAVKTFTSFDVGNILRDAFAVRYQVLLNGKVIDYGQNDQFKFGRDFPDT